MDYKEYKLKAHEGIDQAFARVILQAASEKGLHRHPGRGIRHRLPGRGIRHRKGFRRSGGWEGWTGNGRAWLRDLLCRARGMEWGDLSNQSRKSCDCGWGDSETKCLVHLAGWGVCGGRCTTITYRNGGASMTLLWTTSGDFTRTGARTG